jgi:hypothetical protein
MTEQGELDMTVTYTQEELDATLEDYILKDVVEDEYLHIDSIDDLYISRDVVSSEYTQDEDVEHLKDQAYEDGEEAREEYILSNFDDWSDANPSVFDNISSEAMFCALVSSTHGVNGIIQILFRHRDDITLSDLENALQLIEKKAELLHKET